MIFKRNEPAAMAAALYFLAGAHGHLLLGYRGISVGAATAISASSYASDAAIYFGENHRFTTARACEATRGVDGLFRHGEIISNCDWSPCFRHHSPFLDAISIRAYAHLMARLIICACRQNLKIYHISTQHLPFNTPLAASVMPS